MNCKPGDLALVVRSVAGNEGKIVRCIELITESEWLRPDGSIRREPGWVTEPKLLGWWGEPSSTTPDSNLRPIRETGDDAVDESLSWLPTPVIGFTKETAE